MMSPSYIPPSVSVCALTVAASSAAASNALSIQFVCIFIFAIISEEMLEVGHQAVTDSS